MKVYNFILYVVLIHCTYVNSKALFNDRFKHFENPDEEQQMIIAEEPAPMAFGPPAPYMYQRIAPYMYGDFYPRFRQKFRYVDERPFRRGDYQKRIYFNYDNPDKRQCHSSNKRRSVSYAKQPFKLVPLREDPYYLPEANQMSRVARSERSEKNLMYENNRQEDSENEDSPAEEYGANAKFADDKYPSVLANFKIGSKLDKKSIAESPPLAKREYHQNDSSIAKATDSSSSFEDSETDGKVAEELRDILDYMGLIDEDNNPSAKLSEEKNENSKQDAYEDENLEEGNNKISLTKEEHKAMKDRSKREDKMCQSTELSTVEQQVAESTDQSEHGKEEDRKLNEPHDQLDKSKRDSAKFQDENSTPSNKVRSADAAQSIADKAEASDYEKRVERQIQSRINALKEEVKREIAALKAQEAAQAVHNLNDDKERKKRQAINTLLDEENGDLDPALHPDMDLKPHVRRRRHTNAEDGTLSQSEESVEAVTEEAKRTSRLSDQGEKADDTGTVVEVVSSSNEVSITESTAIQNESSSEDTEASHRRKKREVEYEVNYLPARHKRANSVLAGATLAFVPYRDVEDIEGEVGEMEYDGFYDMVPNIQRKRQALPNAKKRSVSFNQHQNLNRDVQFNQADNLQAARDRRQNFEKEVSSFHSGGPAENHLSSIRARSMAKSRRVRRRAYNDKRIGMNEQPQTLNDMSDSDIFGALPQGYDGELNRFKRVKRNRGKG